MAREGLQSSRGPLRGFPGLWCAMEGTFQEGLPRVLKGTGRGGFYLNVSAEG